MGIFPLVEIPTGDARRGLGAGYTQAFLPVWVQKDFGKWTTYGGGGYWINPGPGNRNYWFFGWTAAAPGDRQAGARRRGVSPDLEHGRPRRDAPALTSAASYDFTDHYHLLFSAGRGGLLYAVDGARVSDPITYYAAFQWTF